MVSHKRLGMGDFEANYDRPSYGDLKFPALKTLCAHPVECDSVAYIKEICIAVGTVIASLVCVRVKDEKKMGHVAFVVMQDEREAENAVKELSQILPKVMSFSIMKREITLKTFVPLHLLTQNVNVCGCLPDGKSDRDSIKQHQISTKSKPSIVNPIPSVKASSASISESLSTVPLLKASSVETSASNWKAVTSQNHAVAASTTVNGSQQVKTNTFDSGKAKDCSGGNMPSRGDEEVGRDKPTAVNTGTSLPFASPASEVIKQQYYFTKSSDNSETTTSSGDTFSSSSPNDSVTSRSTGISEASNSLANLKLTPAKAPVVGQQKTDNKDDSDCSIQLPTSDRRKNCRTEN